mmetsp:Transcript_30458/g.89040  ORF Transcript_30458/g.89040 Transcript_30458/m.89040 type:complete len:172 (+) Transcript_30458:671-1186(+)
MYIIGLQGHAYRRLSYSKFRRTTKEDPCQPSTFCTDHRSQTIEEFLVHLFVVENNSFNNLEELTSEPIKPLLIAMPSIYGFDIKEKFMKRRSGIDELRTLSLPALLDDMSWEAEFFRGGLIKTIIRLERLIDRNQILGHLFRLDAVDNPPSKIIEDGLGVVGDDVEVVNVD